MCGREPGLRAGFDGVLARSFGRPAVLAECAAPLLRVGGWLLVSEPPRSDLEDGQDVRWPAEPLRQLGLELAEVIHEGFEYRTLRRARAVPRPLPPAQRGPGQEASVLRRCGPGWCATEGREHEELLRRPQRLGSEARCSCPLGSGTAPWAPWRYLSGSRRRAAYGVGWATELASPCGDGTLRRPRRALRRRPSVVRGVAWRTARPGLSTRRLFHVERPGETSGGVPRGTTSSLDLGTLAGQDRRCAAAFRKSYLMRIRRRDKDSC